MINKLTNTVKPLDEVDKINEIIDALDNKQDTLVSGTNIKTINSNSILGSGNLVLDGLPSQTGNANKFLTTDGTDASWAAIPTRNIGEIVASTIPLTDAGLHLLDGALIQGDGIYSAFVDYIAELYDNTTSSWETYIQPTNPRGITSSSGFSNPSNAFDNNSSTYASCATTTDYIEWDLGQTLKVSGFNATIQWVSGSAASCNMAIYSVDDNNNETLIANGSGVVGGASGTSSANFSGIEVNKLRFKIIANDAGNVPITSTPSRIVQINIIAQKEVKPIFCSEANWQASVTQYGVCGKFVYDSTNNTVRLPKITGIVEGTTDATALGDLVEAGLPNITGSVGQGYQSNTINGGFHNYSNKGFGTGSLYLDGTTNGNTCTWQKYGDAGLLKIDASRSSSIYGNSSTVQPQTIKAFYYIVIATSTKTDVQVNIDEIATDLNGKADIDLTNTTPAISFATAMNNAGIRTVVETYINGTSWYRVYSDGWCEQGGIINSVSQDSYTSATVSLLKSYKNTNYSVLLTQWDNGQTLGLDGATNGQAVHSKGVNNFVIATYSWTYGRMWQACGYIR